MSADPPALPGTGLLRCGLRPQNYKKYFSHTIECSESRCKKATERLGSLGGMGLVVYFGTSALLCFEFLLFLEFAFGFFDAEAGVHFEKVSEVVGQASTKHHV